MSQKSKILRYLKMGGKLTPIDALHNYECFRLSARVKELRKEGHAIKTVRIQQNGKTFARYELQTGN